MIKTLQKLKIEGTYFHLIKAVCDKSIVNIKREKALISFLRFGTRQGSPLTQCLLNIVLEILTKAVRQEKEIKGIQTGKEEVKLPQFPDDVILYLKDPTLATRNLLDPKST